MSGQNPFQSWLEVCILQDEKSNGKSEGSSDAEASRLRQEARLHFEKLSSSSSAGEASKSTTTPPSPSLSKRSSTVEEDISEASSTTPNGALALLVSSLGPAFESSSNTNAKVCALHCLMGALEGSVSLTQGVRQAVGRFLVELCRPDSGDNEDRDGEGSDDDDDDDDAGQAMDYVDADNLSPEEITQQLEAMGQAQEQRKKKTPSTERSGKSSSSSYVHDDVRDAAIACLKALLQSHLEIFPTQQSQSQQASYKDTASSPLVEAMGVVYQSMELRVELAMLGVKYRCGADNTVKSSNDEDGLWGEAGAGYETTDPELNIEDGLSKLPRLKRSFCFDLLEGALDGFKDDGLKWNILQSQLKEESQSDDAKECVVPSYLLTSMPEFASLTSSCMHGETDPRCLLQLLRLLNKVQQTMLPLFAFHENNTEGKVEMLFLSIEIFDSVAPYYPVQFTPPKNDPHGITRDMLQDALMAVLCERGALYISPTPTREKNGGEDHGEGKDETMIILAGRMFLERLEPPKSSEFDPPSNGAESEMEDKLDAVKDLSSLLLLPSAADNSNQPFSMNATRATPAFFSELSSSMARVHEEAVSSDSNSLASAIRTFSSSLAHALEPSTVRNKGNNDSNETSTTSALWEAYVVDILRHLAPILGSAPQGLHGRASTAYLASLAAEGGMMTLKKVLEGCYPRFLGILSVLGNNDDSDEAESKSQSNKQKNRDEEKLASAVRGVAALVASCRVALQKYERENSGAQVHPHPLSPYISATIQKISFVLNEPQGEEEIKPLSLAAVGVLESVLTSADLVDLAEEYMSSLEKMLSLMSHVILSEEGSNAKNQDEWKAACARVLGAVIALGLCENEPSDNVKPNNCERMNAMATSLLPEILASATSPPRDPAKLHAARYDWMVLARACANGTCSVSEQIVSELLSKMVAALRSGQTNQLAPALALSYLVRHGGSNVGKVFHSLPSTGPTSFDVIQDLCQPLKQPGDLEDSMESGGQGRSGAMRVGLSVLQLPGSGVGDEKQAHDAIERASLVLPFLIPAYECPSSVSSCGGLVQFVDQILPPLSKWDEVKLYVAFPLLAAVLNSSNQVWRTLDSATLESLRSMVAYLAEFSISADYDARSRSAAAKCLFSVLFHSSQDDGCDGDIETLHTLLEEVHQVVTDAVTCLEKEATETITPQKSGNPKALEESMHASFSRIEDALSFMGLLGSAAACKGGPFSRTADNIASFLIELACNGRVKFPCTETTVQLAKPSVEGQKNPLMNPASHAYILPATSFGSMLSVHNGGPFWRQRMTHKTLPVLLKALKVQAKSQNPPALGTLAVVCHMLCCLPASLLGESNVKQILPTLIAGLVYFSKNLTGLAQSKRISSKPTDLLSIILAALMKILSVSPEYVTKFIRIIIPSLLLLCSPTESSEMYIPKQLIVLQSLETVAAHPQARNSVLREKDQVVTVLSALMDHPSMIVRNAVVQVRNVWFTLE